MQAWALSGVEGLRAFQRDRHPPVEFPRMPKAITFTTTYPYPIEQVWKALTDAQAMSEWLMPCNIEPRVGHRFQFQTKPYPGFDGIVHCKVLEVVPLKTLSFSWSGGSLKDTVVSFRLRAVGDHTELVFEHRGFEGFFNTLVVRNLLANGWKKKILRIQLPNYLAL